MGDGRVGRLKVESSAQCGFISHRSTCTPHTSKTRPTIILPTHPPTHPHAHTTPAKAAAAATTTNVAERWRRRAVAPGGPRQAGKPQAAPAWGLPAFRREDAASRRRRLGQTGGRERRRGWRRTDGDTDRRAAGGQGGRQAGRRGLRAPPAAPGLASEADGQTGRRADGQTDGDRQGQPDTTRRRRRRRQRRRRRRRQRKSRKQRQSRRDSYNQTDRKERRRRRSGRTDGRTDGQTLRVKTDRQTATVKPA